MNANTQLETSCGAKDFQIRRADIANPPNYTPYPNPHLAEFIARHVAEKPYVEETDEYHRDPFTRDISEGKNDPVYNAHSYHTKVPPKAIEPYILHYTEPGDLILDPFCGSGMTGVAALRHNRKVILIDLSPAATFIAYNYVTPVDPREFEMAARQVLEAVKEEMDWLYETRCRRCGGKARIEYTIWSDVFRHYCGAEFPLWEVAVDKENGKVLRDFACPGCGQEVTKRELKRVSSIPVRVNYSCPRHKRQEDDVCDFDLQRLKEIEEKWEVKSKEIWYPTYRMPEGDESRRNDKIGITHVHNFYTNRNLWALSEIWAQIDKLDILSIKNYLRFGFTSIIPYCCKKQSFGGGGGGVSGTLYIPSFQMEKSVEEIIFRKYKNLFRVSSYLFKTNKSIVSTQSAGNINNILNNSIDYIFTDPPFGSNLMYSELNFLWEAWLGWFTNNAEEAIINKVQGKGINEYKNLMAQCLAEMYRVLKPGRYLTMVFHNSKKEVWDAIRDGLSDAGFELVSINVLDKKQKSFKAVTSEGAVGYDVVLNCRKPKTMATSFSRNGIAEETVGQVLRVVKEILTDTPVTETEKRTARFIYSSLVDHFNGTVPMDYEKVKKVLDANFKKIDEAFYLWNQLPQKGNQQLEQLTFIDEGYSITSEKELVEWLTEFLSEPREWDEIHPQLLKHLDQNARIDKDFREILEENFILDEMTQKWRRPQPGEEDVLKTMREKRLLREFNAFLGRYGETKRLRDIPPLAAIEAGFKTLIDKGEYKLIVEVGGRLPEEAKSAVIKGLILAARSKL